MATRPCPGYSGKTLECVDGYRAPSRAGPAAPPEFGIFRQLRLIGYMVEIRVRYVTNNERIVNIVPLLPLWPMAAAGD
jgi:hypothetical protein